MGCDRRQGLEAVRSCIARPRATVPSVIPRLRQRRGARSGQGGFDVVGVRIGVIDEDDCKTNQQPHLKHIPGRRTVSGNVQPHAVLVESVLVRIESLQISATLGRLVESIVHGRVLLMAKDDTLAGPTLSTTFKTLCALGSLFVTCELGQPGRGARRAGVTTPTFQLPSSTCQAVKT